MTEKPEGTLNTSINLHVILERWPDAYVARVADVAGIVDQGDTPREALDNLREAVLFTLRVEDKDG